jgi:hypothetical protein
MLWFEFQARKSTQAAAFLLKLYGKQKDKYLLLKMIYLADREALKKWNVSITGDSPHSMRWGPVPSNIYDFTKGAIHYGTIWGDCIETVKNETLILHDDPGTDELSQDEMNLLNEVFEKFKNYSFEDMKKFCHDFPEYDNTVGAGSRPIPFGTMLNAVGKSGEDMSHIAKNIIEMQRMKAVFGE